MTPALEDLLEAIRTAPRDWIPSVLAGALARAMELPVPEPEKPAHREPERWLTVAQAAERMGTTARAIYHKIYSEQWEPMVRRNGRSLRISARALADYMESCRLRP